ncbi:ATP-binding protein [Halorussus salilacus]|uniref:ATP-binding protein n=1 Tax=Halorussus salilacus TaxID=2953750 RepID=UPI00209E705E|nr:ATP-binding protein [Halorussus salilacus]USZ67639.1 ATP-binding protein [Halorussus salilacus]
MTDLGDFENFEGDDTASDAPARDDTETSAAADDDRFESMDPSPVGTDRGIGTLSAAGGLRIGEEEDDTRVRAYVTADNREDVRVGKYLLVPYPDDEKLFCRISALSYEQEYQVDDATEIHSKRAMRREAIEETDYKLMATLEPVAVLYSDEGDLKRRMTDRVPKPKAVVRQADDKAEIKTGLKMPEDGVFLGHLSVGGEKVRTAAQPPTIDYRLKDDYADGDPLVFRHTLVAGGTGSGKTHGAKNVLRQFLAEERRYEMEDGAKRRAAVVQFDPQDEYAQMHDDNPEVTAEDERGWEREGIAHGGHDDTLVLAPKENGVSYSPDNHRAEYETFTVPFSMASNRPWLVAGSSLNENQYPALKELLGRFFTQRPDGTYRQFLAFLDDPALKEELDESGKVHEATYDAVKRRVRAIPSGIFDQNATPITELDHKLVRRGGLTTIPTYHLTSSRAKELFVLAVASLLIDDKLSNSPESQHIKETPLVVGMDEAHNFLTDADNVQARKVIGKFTDAAKQGRKERLGLFLITQDPQDIADPVFKQVNTTIVLNLGDEDAIKSVNIPAELEGKVPYMEKGQMVVYSPDNSEPVEITGLSKCLTKHGRE